MTSPSYRPTYSRVGFRNQLMASRQNRSPRSISEFKFAEGSLEVSLIDCIPKQRENLWFFFSKEILKKLWNRLVWIFEPQKFAPQWIVNWNGKKRDFWEHFEKKRLLLGTCIKILTQPLKRDFLPAQQQRTRNRRLLTLHGDLPHEMPVGFLRIRWDHRAVTANERLPGVFDVEAGIGLFNDATYHRWSVVYVAVVIRIVLLQKMIRYPLAVDDDTCVWMMVI